MIKEQAQNKIDTLRSMITLEVYCEILEMLENRRFYDVMMYLKTHTGITNITVLATHVQAIYLIEFDELILQELI